MVTRRTFIKLGLAGGAAAAANAQTFLIGKSKDAALPRSIEGCWAWYDAAQAQYSGNGGQQPRALDFSGLGHDAVNQDGRSPVFEAGYALNGIRTWKFTRTAYWKASFKQDISSGTVFLVGLSDQTWLSRFGMDGKNTDGTKCWVLGWGQASAADSKLGMYAGSNVIQDSVNIAGQWVIACAVFNGASSYLYKNGSQVASGNPGTSTLDGITIGNQHALDTTYHYAGGMAELILFRRVLTASERSTMTSHLGSKWGITVV